MGGSDQGSRTPKNITFGPLDQKRALQQKCPIFLLFFAQVYFGKIWIRSHRSIIPGGI